MTDEKRPFSRTMFDYHTALDEFETALCEAGFGAFNSVGGDDYDNSLEIYEVAPDARMGEAAQRVIFDAGFSKAYVNHKDGWETHYAWDRSKFFAPVRGWRRRYVKDPNATTTNVIVGDANPGYYEISHWPDGWGSKEWLDTGYMRIVPDPLDPSVKS